MYNYKIFTNFNYKNLINIIIEESFLINLIKKYFCPSSFSECSPFNQILLSLYDVSSVFYDSI